MSSTNRGAKRSPQDFYPTPAWVVHQLLDAGALPYPFRADRRNWMEPAYGDGAIVRAVADWCMGEKVTNELVQKVVQPSIARPSWTAFEIEPHAVEWVQAKNEKGKLVWAARVTNRMRLPAPDGVTLVYQDFLKLDWKSPMPDVLITNPPFSLAIEFIEHSMRLFPGAYLAFLLRLNFLGAQARSAFWRRHAPDVYVMPKRPSFTPDGKTDSTEYAWFVWPGGKHDRTAGRLEVLEVRDG